MVATWAKAVQRYGKKSLAQQPQARHRGRQARLRGHPGLPASRSRRRWPRCRPSRPAASCSSPPTASRCRSAPGSATPTWHAPTRGWPARARVTSTRGKLRVRRSPARCSIRRFTPGTPAHRPPGHHDRSGTSRTTWPSCATPTHVNYRGLDVWHGAAVQRWHTTGEALNILEHLEPVHRVRARALFHYLEASRLAFADRNAYIGDADYEPVRRPACSTRPTPTTRSCLIGRQPR